MEQLYFSLATAERWPTHHRVRRISRREEVSRYHHAGAKEESKNNSYSFLTSVLDGVSGQRHAPAALYPRERTRGTHWTGCWEGVRPGVQTSQPPIQRVPGVLSQKQGRR
jgi:hypothetical protein